MIFADRARGALLGLAVGDAVGTTLEFRRPGSFEPLTDMVGGGPFRLKKGEWTDDTAMALALADSLAESNDYRPQDILARWLRWYRHGAYSHNGVCFDIGGQTATALEYFEQHGANEGLPRGSNAGNGCIMRAAPIVIWAHRQGRAAAVRYCADQGALTHPAALAVEYAAAFGGLLFDLLDGGAIDTAHYRGVPACDVPATGFVKHSYEAALWAFENSGDFRSAILMAANLGNDADTTAAIAGQICGAHYGVGGIPEDWLSALAWRNRIEDWADRLVGAA